MNSFDTHAFIDSARRTFRIESETLSDTIASLDAEAFALACQLLLECKGHVVLSGMGKSGHIARKIASTMTSTGTRAIFLHPAEAAHGDLGVLQHDDVLLVLSKSGASDELQLLVAAAVQRGVPIVAITSNPNSPLAERATVSLIAVVREEACPNDLAPTSSTTAQLVLGDALAVALLEARGFTSEDFAKLHPAGALGRRLTMTVDDLMMRASALPLVSPDTPLSATLLEISGKRLGAVCVIDSDHRLLGIVTDGDVRRFFQTRTSVDLATIKAGDLMSASAKTTTAETLAIDALHHMEDSLPKVMQLPVLDNDRRVVGMVHLHDIVKAGIA